MTEKQLAVYADLFQKLSLTELKVKEEGISLCMKKSSKNENVDKEKLDNDIRVSRKATVGQEEIKAPLLGIFHRAPSPKEPAFVEEGDRVKKGDVLCVIEAMKMMNEVIAGKEGMITEICAEDNTIVEYGQTIFRIE